MEWNFINYAQEGSMNIKNALLRLAYKHGYAYLYNTCKTDNPLETGRRMALALKGVEGINKTLLHIITEVLIANKDITEEGKEHYFQELCKYFYSLNILKED